VTYQASAARPGLVGGGGTFSLLLNAAAAGTAKVTLVYARSWEKDKPPAETFTATFAVKPVPASLPIPQE
jgi:predicted secreted protein